MQKSRREVTQNLTTLTFSGVITEAFLDLDMALRSADMREEEIFAGVVTKFGEYAQIIRTHWSVSCRTMTVTVVIFPFQRWCLNPDAGEEGRLFTFNEQRPTPRSVVSKIFDALGRHTD